MRPLTHSRVMRCSSSACPMCLYSLSSCHRPVASHRVVMTASWLGVDEDGNGGTVACGYDLTTVRHCAPINWASINQLLLPDAPSHSLSPEFSRICHCVADRSEE